MTQAKSFQLWLNYFPSRILLRYILTIMILFRLSSPFLLYSIALTAPLHTVVHLEWVADNHDIHKQVQHWLVIFPLRHQVMQHSHARPFANYTIRTSV